MVSLRIRSNYGGGDSGGDPVRYFRNLTTRIEDGVAAEMQQAVEDGEATMKDMIAHRGTPKSGKQGRIETRKMIDAVTSKVYPPTAKGNQVGRFGWLDEYENYFGFQEGGFEHESGVTVEGMYAMVDAAELVFREFDQAVDKVIRNV